MMIMKIQKINFTGKIIDSHAHVGEHEGIVYSKEQLDVFIKSALPNNDTVEKMIVSDLDVLHGVKSEYEGNKAALNLFRGNDRYALLASCNPRSGNIDQLKQIFRENPNIFKGLKFHSYIQNLDLSDKKYEPYLDFAAENNLPCLFHSQVETLNDGRINRELKHIADPENIYALAKKYPQTPIVMAHLGAGWREAHDKAIDILIESIKNNDANLYADVSWVDIDAPQTHIIQAIKRLKGFGETNWKHGDQSFRLVFGTDAPLSRFRKENATKKYSKFVENIKNAIRNDQDLKLEAEKIIEDLFYNNSKKLYFKHHCKL